MDQIIKKYNECAVSKIASPDSLFQAIEFVVNTNFKKYNILESTNERISLINEIYSFELQHLDKIYFYKAEDPDGNIIGTIRVMKCDESFSYPFHEAIHPMLFEGRNLWHVGRFAVDHSANTLINAISFKRLVLYAFSHICENVSNILIAECDKKLFTTLNRMKINIRKMGNPFKCMGSETLPVMAYYNDIYPFFKEEMHRL